MAKRSNRNGAGEPAADAPDHADGNQRDDYEVGYRKPPAATQFKKGHSGNPFGRPRKPKPRKVRLGDDPFDTFLEREAFRLVTIRENGRASKIPAAQAILRVNFAKALGGHRLPAKYVLDKIEAKGKEHLDRRIDRYVELARLKAEGEQKIAECKRRSLPPPALLPHPDDIVLRPTTAEAFVDGPKTPDEDQAYQWLAVWRDHLLLLSAHSEKTGSRSTIEYEGRICCWHMVRATSANNVLPKRYQWANNGRPASLLLEYRSLSKQESERRIAVEREELDKTSPVDRYIDPETQKDLKRRVEQLRKMRNRKKE